jgi:microsomal dipeptidase-like Zn-dependent dipeptidase
MAEHQSKLQGVVKVRVKQDVSLDQLHSLIDQIAGMSGCRTCGIMGVDFRLSGDPAELEQIAKLPAVTSASLGE